MTLRDRRIADRMEKKVLSHHTKKRRLNEVENYTGITQLKAYFKIYSRILDEKLKAKVENCFCYARMGEQRWHSG